MAKRCAFPGCNAALWPGAVVGVCKTHLHRAGYCRCKRCFDHPREVNEPKREIREPYRPTSPWGDAERKA